MINVMPINDIKEHIEDIDCPCNPTLSYQDDEVIVIHTPYDGRDKELLADNQLFLAKEQLN